MKKRSAKLKRLPDDAEIRTQDRHAFKELMTRQEAYELLRCLEFDWNNKVVKYYLKRGARHYSEILQAYSRNVGEEVEKRNWKTKEKYWSYYKLEIEDIRKHTLSGHRHEPKGYKGPAKLYVDAGNGDGEHRFLTDAEMDLLHQKEKSIALTGTKTAKIMAIDIDDHDNNTDYSEKATDILFKVLKDFNFVEPLFIEKSRENGGYHLFLKFNDFITHEDIQKYRDNFKDRYGFTFDLRTPEKALKIPFSATYETVKIKNIFELQNGTGKNLEFEYILSFQAAMKDTIEHQEYREIPKELLEIHTGKFETITKLISIMDEPFISRTKRKNITSTSGKTAKNINCDYPMYAGNRVAGTQMQIKLAFACIQQNKSFDEFFELSMRNNVDSKDLSGSQEKALKDSKSVYDWAEKSYNGERRSSTNNTNKYTGEDFISNLNRLTPEMEKLSKILAMKFVQSKTYVYNKWAREHLKAFTIVIKEIIGYIIYQYENPRVINSNYPLTMNKKKEIEKGYQFPREWAERLKKHYGLKCNIHGLFNYIAKSGILLKQYKHTKSGWKWGGEITYCRQWLFAREDTAYIFFNNCPMPENIMELMVEILKFGIKLINVKLFPGYSKEHKILRREYKSSRVLRVINNKDREGREKKEIYSYIKSFIFNKCLYSRLFMINLN